MQGLLDMLQGGGQVVMGGWTAIIDLLATVPKSMVDNNSNIDNIEIDSNYSCLITEEYMSDILTAYFKQVGRHKLLTKQEEISLTKKIEAGDTRAREKMINSNLRLAISIASKYAQYGNVSYEDLIQEANIGLIKAIEKYDWRRGFKFSTYACWWIKQSVRKHVASHGNSIKLPSHAKGMLWKMRQYKEEYEEEFGSEISDSEAEKILTVGDAVKFIESKAN